MEEDGAASWCISFLDEHTEWVGSYYSVDEPSPSLALSLLEQYDATHYEIEKID